MPSYRVIVLDRLGEVVKEVPVAARSVPKAAQEATGEDLTRGDRGESYWLRAKVYATAGATPSMTRFYSSEAAPGS